MENVIDDLAEQRTQRYKSLSMKTNSDENGFDIKRNSFSNQFHQKAFRSLNYKFNVESSGGELRHLDEAV